MDDLSSLSIEEQIVFHVAALKRLRASMLRSDWHAALEAALRLATDKYGDAIHLLVEEELGIEPPRADFIIVRQDRGVTLDEPIFDHFRGQNIIEYKNRMTCSMNLCCGKPSAMPDCISLRGM